MRSRKSYYAILLLLVGLLILAVLANGPATQAPGIGMAAGMVAAGCADGLNSPPPGRLQTATYRPVAIFFISPACETRPSQPAEPQRLTTMVPDCWLVLRYLPPASD
jgi:hypothetical protein